jgi:hypothetical protein
MANEAIKDALLIEIPNNILGTFNLSQLTFTYHENYLMAGLTPTFDRKKAAYLFEGWTF